jgi:DNA-binding CsgD family transcriptional regulator
VFLQSADRSNGAAAPVSGASPATDACPTLVPSLRVTGETGAFALLLEHDGLLRLLAEQALLALGMRPLPGGAPAAGSAAAPCAGVPRTVFIGLDRPGLSCAGTEPRISPPGAGVLRVGYAARSAGLLGAHRAHGCCDAYLELSPGSGGAVFAHPRPGSLVDRAGLTPREADVLLLLAAGSTTPVVAARLCVSPATARSHCRSVLRKMGATDRRRLRDLLDAGS